MKLTEKSFDVISIYYTMRCDSKKPNSLAAALFRLQEGYSIRLIMPLNGIGSDHKPFIFI